MKIEIRDPELVARMVKQQQVSDCEIMEDVVRRLLQTPEEQDRRLLENRDAVNAKSEGVAKNRYLAELE